MNELADVNKLIPYLAELLGEVGFDAETVQQILAQIKTYDDIDHLIYQIQDFFNTKRVALDAQTKFYNTFPQVYPAVMALQTASGLTNEAAKTCVYYAVGTYGLEQLQLYPILLFQGATGTGKSDAMKVLAQLVYKPSWLGTKSPIDMVSKLLRHR